MVRSDLPVVFAVVTACALVLAPLGCGSPEHPPMACLGDCDFDAGPDTRDASLDAPDARDGAADAPHDTADASDAADTATDAATDTGPVGNNPCHNVAGDYARIEGDPTDSIFPGVLEAGKGVAATFTVVSELPNLVTVRATRIVDDTPILFLFSSRQLGAPLAAKKYPSAVRVDHEGPGVAGFTLTVSNRTCDTVGSFEIVAISFDASGHLRGLEATLSRECQDVSGTMTGCIKYGVVP